MFEALAIRSMEYIEFQLANNHRAPVSADQLPRLIAQHKNSGSFYIEVLLDQPVLSTMAEVN